MYFVEKSKGTNFAKQFDYTLFIAVTILSATGILILSSATKSMQSGSRLMMMQSIGLAIGIILALIISFIDYKDLKTLGFVLYLVGIVLLVSVLIIGTGDQYGGRSWIKFGGITFQPSELAKITFIIVASVFLERIKEGNKEKNIVKLLMYSALPIGLVLLQPDFGSAMVFVFAFFIMIFICEIPYKHIVITLGTFIMSLPFLWLFALKPYQKDRIRVFFFPESDPTFRGYHVLQSKRVIGSGQLMGKGLFEGVQTQNGIVPVKESDFIFTVIGEELGFIGSALIVALIFFILLRCIHIAKNSRDPFGSFLVIGITAMMAFHFFENIGMCIGLLPVTGIPLPFISSGGTAMITNYIAIGIVLSVSMRRHKTIFNTTQ